MSGCETLVVWSPHSIRECCEHDDGTPIDCFDDAVPETNPYKEMLVRYLWSTYRHRPIDALDVCRWLEDLTDRAFLLDATFQQIIKAYEDADKSDLGTGWKDISTVTGSDVTLTEQEDIPQSVAAGSDVWLSGRSKTEVTPGTTGTVEHTDKGSLAFEKLDRLIKSARDPYRLYCDIFADLFLNRW